VGSLGSKIRYVWQFPVSDFSHMCETNSAVKQFPLVSTLWYTSHG